MPSNRAVNTKETAKVFNIRVAKCEDEDRILNFLRVHYYREEPLTIGSEPKEQDSDDEAFTMSNISHGTCIVAEAESEAEKNRIAGVVIASPKDRHEVDHLFEEAASYGPQSKWGRILKILARIERDANVFERFNVERAVHAHAMSVDTQYRGCGLSIRMIKELIAVSRNLNYELLTMDCTSVFSARICERLGMECVNALRFEDHCDEQGNQVFKPPAPHDVIKTYALRL